MDIGPGLPGEDMFRYQQEEGWDIFRAPNLG